MLISELYLYKEWLQLNMDFILIQRGPMQPPPFLLHETHMSCYSYFQEEVA
jgi:hypothetical protein